MTEWRRLYRHYPLDETDALLVATCTVHGLDLVTVDYGLVRTLVEYQHEFTSPDYGITIYYAADPMPAAADE